MCVCVYCSDVLIQIQKREIKVEAHERERSDQNKIFSAIQYARTAQNRTENSRILVLVLTEVFSMVSE